MIANYIGNPALISYLINQGADTKSSDAKGKTAFSYIIAKKKQQYQKLQDFSKYSNTDDNITT